jgi:hypothetical protein
MKIPRGSYDNRALKPAWLAVGANADGTPHRPIIRCACGKLAGTRSHHVHADGRVTASFYHPLEGWDKYDAPGCGFHEFLELEGYDGPEFPAESQ